MQEIGRYLKKARESQKLSLEDVASRTKIHLHKLSAIEEGDRESLPAKVFCIGLIKSYARELKVDMERVDQLCAEAFNEKEAPTEAVTPEKPKSEKEEATSKQPVGRFQIPKIMAYAASGAVSLALLFVIYLVIEKMNSYSQEEELPAEVYTNIRVDKDSKPEETEVENETSVADSEETEKSLSQAPAQDKENKTETLEAKQQAPAPSADPVPQSTEPAKPKVAANDFQDDNNFDEPFNGDKPIVVSDNKLIVTALEPVRAEVVWSDGYVQVMLLKSQETKTLVFSTPIKLRVNNGGAVQVSFNDGDKKVPGNFNQPIELDYP